MPQTLLRLIFATLFACQALPASALFALPSECQAQDFNLACEPTEGPHDSEIALLVGNALMHKLIDNDPQLALPLLGSNFLQDWSIAWASFPVPAAIESLISGLDTDRFDEWINLLCANLHANVPPSQVINFQQMPLVVINSFPATASSTVPLPASLWLFTSAILGLAVGGKHRKQ